MSAASWAWSCQSGEVVGTDDTVAIIYGTSKETVVRITGGGQNEITCEVVSSSGGPEPGKTIKIEPGQLLLRVPACKS